MLVDRRDPLDQRGTSDRGIEAELREANRQLREERHIFISGPVVVFKWRNEPGWPVEYASPNVGQVFGYTAQEFLERQVVYADLIPPDDLPRVTAEVGKGSEGMNASFEHTPYRIVRRDGRPIWLLDFTTILRDAAGRITHYLGYVIDVTERREAQEARRKIEIQMLQAQKLESLGLLAGGIAHDFNNLLTGILGHAALLRQELDARSPLDKGLADIEAGAMRAAELCNQMLAYSGRGRFTVEAIDVNDLVQGMAALLQVSISKNARLEVQGAPGLPAIEANATQIRQVVMNLITNASEAIGDRTGTITISTGSAQWSADELGLDWLGNGFCDGEYVSIRVVDTGAGMDAETVDRIFDPFFSTKFTGRGLGLAAVLGIVRGHRGAIRVQSTPGEGTTVEVLFPASPKSPLPAKADPPQLESWKATGTILLVDDEEVVRGAVGEMLRRAGFRVVSGRNGQEALEIFARDRAEIVGVVLDVTMPVLGGLETCAALRRLSPDVPIVMISGYDPIDVAGRFEPRVFDAFVQKPFRPVTLLREIRRVIEARATQDPA